MVFPVIVYFNLICSSGDLNISIPNMGKSEIVYHGFRSDLCGAAAIGKDQNALFDGNKYEQKISIDEKNISVKDLMKKIVSVSGEKIDVGKDLEKCRLKIRVKDHKISDILNYIGELYDGEYKKVDGRLYFSMKKARGEEARNWWKIYSKEKDLAIRQLAQIRRKAFDNVPPGKQAGQEATEATFWKNMSNDLKDEIANDIDQRYFYKLDPTTLLHHRFQNSILVNKKFLSTDVLNQVSSSLKSYQAGTSGAEFKFDNVALKWSVSNASIAAVKDNVNIATGLQISFSPNNPEEEKLVKKIYSVIYPDHKKLQVFFDKDLEVSRNIKELIAASKRTFWADGMVPENNSGESLDIYSRNNVLDCLAENADFEFISDLYYQPEVLLPEKEKKGILAGMPEKVIKKYMNGWDVSVKKRANTVYLIRNNKWYRDDYLMPDIKDCDALVHIYEKAASVEPDKATDWDHELLKACSDVIKSNSMFQIANGLSYYIPDQNVKSILFKDGYAYPLSQISDFILYKYELLSFVNELNEEMFNAITSTGVAYGNLSSSLREKLFKIPSVRSRPPVNPDDVLKIKVIRSPLIMEFRSVNVGIIPRLMNIDYVVEVTGR